MSDYVRITTSLSAIIAAAQQIGAAAEQFSSDVERLIGDIEALEGDDKLGTDHFGNGFRDNAYHKLVDAGDGGSVQVNQAGKEAARGGGKGGAHLADGATTAMVRYGMADAENESGIDSV